MAAKPVSLVKQTRQISEAEILTSQEVEAYRRSGGEIDNLDSAHFKLDAAYPYIIDIVNAVCSVDALKECVILPDPRDEAPFYRVVLPRDVFFALAIGARGQSRLKDYNKLKGAFHTQVVSTMHAAPEQITIVKTGEDSIIERGYKVPPVRVIPLYDKVTARPKQHENLKNYRPSVSITEKVQIEFFKPMFEPLMENTNDRGWFWLPPNFQARLWKARNMLKDNYKTAQYKNDVHKLAAKQIGKMSLRSCRSLLLYIFLHKNNQDRFSVPLRDLLEACDKSRLMDRKELKDGTIKYYPRKKEIEAFFSNCILLYDMVFYTDFLFKKIGSIRTLQMPNEIKIDGDKAVISMTDARYFAQYIQTNYADDPIFKGVLTHIE